MSNLRFFDLNCTIGFKWRKTVGEFTDKESLIKEMDYYGIHEAVVTHNTSLRYDPMLGNNKLLEEIKGEKRLYPCWVLVPPATGEIGEPSEFVKNFLKKGVRIVSFYPKDHNFSISDWSCGKLFKVLEKYRIPVKINVDQIQWHELYEICQKYPEMPVIIGGVCDLYVRFLYSILEKCPNLYIDLSGFPLHFGIEDIVKKFGEKRLLFGSGMPSFSPGASMMMVTHACITERQKQKIAGDNLRSLLNNVKTTEKIEFISFRKELSNFTWQKIDFPVFDVHAHLGPFYGRFVPGNNPKDLISVMDNLNVAIMCISSSSLYFDYHIANDFIAQLVREYPDRFFGYMIINPNYPEDIENEMERCLNMGLKGVKIHPLFHRCPITGENYRKVFEFAKQKRCLILSHSQINDQYCDPLLFDEIARDYPEVTFILAHGGNEPYKGVAKCIEVMKKRPNVYTDTSWSPQVYYGVMEEILKKSDPDRWLFGSDVVWLSLSHQLGAFLSAKISDKNREKILYLNAKKLLENYK